jgi:amino acid transporter
MRAFKAQGISRDILPYKGPWQPYLSWYGLVFNTLIIITQGFTAFMPSFSVTDFFINYLSLFLFAALYVGHKIAFRQPLVKPEEADIYTGRLEFED